MRIRNPYQYFAPEQPSLDAVMNGPFMITEIQVCKSARPFSVRAMSAKVMSAIDINRTFYLLLDAVEKWKA